MRRTLGRLALSTEPDSPVQVVKPHTDIRKREERCAPGQQTFILMSSQGALADAGLISRISHKSSLAALDHFKPGTSTSIYFMWRGSERLGLRQGLFSRFHEPTKANRVNYTWCQKQQWFPLVYVKNFFCCDAFSWPQYTMEAQCTVACAAAIKWATCG